jgi:D-aminopeptidase
MAETRSLREHGLHIGALNPGPSNSIADVGDVTVGHITVVRDEPDLPSGRGVARSGVTTIVPRDPARLRPKPVVAGVAVLNGAGEMTGSLQVSEWGTLETPIYLTATMSVGRIFDGAVTAAMAADPAIGVDDVVIPVVAECDDSWLNDARIVQVDADDAGRAVESAGGEIAQGAVGAGTGMICFDYKGGIGTSSRIAGDDVTVGVLVLANFGSRPDLRVDGVPVGRLIGETSAASRSTQPGGSCIAVVATDAPLTSAQLCRVARRAGLGLGRTGSVGHHYSGEIFLAFSTAARSPATQYGGDLDPLFSATVDATEEAVLNALWNAETTQGREGRVVEALPRDEVLELLRAHRRLER